MAPSIRAFSVSILFLFMQKTAYGVRISDWSSDLCSSDLRAPQLVVRFLREGRAGFALDDRLIFLDQRLPVFGRHFGVVVEALVFLRDFQRSEELRVGQEGVSTGISRWSPHM